MAKVTKSLAAVDPTGEATTVAAGPEKVSDPALITVREYPGLGVEDAVGRFLVDEVVDAADVTAVLAVADPVAGGVAGRPLPDGLGAVFGLERVSFLDRRDAQVRARLEDAPGVGVVTAAGLSMGDDGRGEGPPVDLPTVEALFEADPVGFERWAVRAVDGSN